MKIRHCHVLALGATGLMLTACLSGPDRFYRLQALPAQTVGARQHFSAEVSIRLSIPSLVDQSQIVLDQGSGVVVLEHERWASPLVDQLHAVLGQDIEQRRPDVLITSRPLSQAAGTPRYAVQVEVVALTLRRGGAVQMEARWRVDGPDTTAVVMGRETFSAVPTDLSPAAMAAGLSDCVAQLAERLVPHLGPG